MQCATAANDWLNYRPSDYALPVLRAIGIAKTCVKTHIYKKKGKWAQDNIHCLCAGYTICSEKNYRVLTPPPLGAAKAGKNQVKIIGISKYSPFSQLG